MNDCANRLFESKQTCNGEGFEEPTLFATQEDGLLHFIGHNHGQCKEKYVSAAWSTRTVVEQFWAALTIILLM